MVRFLRFLLTDRTEHDRILAELHRSQKLSESRFELYVTYYKEILASHRGIRRLKRKIASMHAGTGLIADRGCYACKIVKFLSEAPK